MNNKIVLKMTSSILLCTMLAYTLPVFAFTKDETVYSKLDSNGYNYSTIVNSHLKNENAEQIINDLSDLINIENVNGDESFKQNGNNLVWTANGSDIYYQGESQKELPIECNVRYELNDTEIDVKDLLGKSGKVKIIIEYKNKDEHFVNINGKNEKLYTPFVVVCGTIINNKDNKNIAISNGKVVDNGNKTTVFGICLPGLQESLDISKEKLDIPNSIEISMETTDFEMNNVVTFVSPKVIENSDLNLFDKLDDVYMKVNTLQSSSKQLEDGVNILRNGAITYNEKSTEFNSAMKQVSIGVNSANSNYSKIDNGINSLNKNSKALESGAKSVSDGTKAISANLKIISSSLDTLQNGTKELQNSEKQLIAGLDKIISSVNCINVTDNSAKIAELERLVKANEDTIKTLKDANSTLNSQLSALNKNISPNDDVTTQTKETIKAQIASNKSLISLLEINIKVTKETISTLKSTDASAIKELRNGLNSLKNGSQNIKAGIDSIYNGQSSLKDGIDSLASKTDELSNGATFLYNGTVKVSEGTKTLSTGSYEMKKGLNTLDTGTTQLTIANNALTDGANTLANGASTLADGMNKFNKEGIQSICNYINGNLKNTSMRLEKLQDLANAYNNFTMLNNGDNGNIKFILIMDSIKKSDVSKQKMILPDDTNK